MTTEKTDDRLLIKGIWIGGIISVVGSVVGSVIGSLLTWIFL